MSRSFFEGGNCKAFATLILIDFPKNFLDFVSAREWTRSTCSAVRSADNDNDNTAFHSWKISRRSKNAAIKNSRFSVVQSALWFVYPVLWKRQKTAILCNKPRHRPYAAPTVFTIENATSSEKSSIEKVCNDRREKWVFLVVLGSEKIAQEVLLNYAQLPRSWQKQAANATACNPKGDSIDSVRFELFKWRLYRPPQLLLSRNAQKVP